MSERNPNQHLYGIDGWDDLYTDLDDAIEHYGTNSFADPGEVREVVFTEWDTVPVAAHLPNAEWVLEQIAEWAGENGMLDSDGFERFDEVCRQVDITKRMAYLLEVIGSRVTYYMADTVVATHTVAIRTAPDDSVTFTWEIVTKSRTDPQPGDNPVRNDEASPPQR